MQTAFVYLSFSVTSTLAFPSYLLEISSLIARRKVHVKF